MFSELQNLSGDKGGKMLFSRYPIQWVVWHDPRQLVDIDTPGGNLPLFYQENMKFVYLLEHLLVQQLIEN
jgi:hypothetical protein